VHNYATIGLIREHGRTPGGQRLFDESVFHRLHRIRRLKRRYRLHEIRRILETEDTAPPAGRVYPPKAGHRATQGPDAGAASPHPTPATEDEAHRGT